MRKLIFISLFLLCHNAWGQSSAYTWPWGIPLNHPGDTLGSWVTTIDDTTTQVKTKKFFWDIMANRLNTYLTRYHGVRSDTLYDKWIKFGNGAIFDGNSTGDLGLNKPLDVSLTNITWALSAINFGNGEGVYAQSSGSGTGVEGFSSTGFGMYGHGGIYGGYFRAGSGGIPLIADYNGSWRFRVDSIARLTTDILPTKDDSSVAGTQAKRWRSVWADTLLSTAPLRILSGGTNNTAFNPGKIVTFDGTKLRSTNIDTGAAGGGTVLGVTATAPLASSGGTNPNITADTSAGNTHLASQAFVLNHSSGLSGGTNTDVAYWTGSTSLGADGNFTWTTGTKTLNLTASGLLEAGSVFGSTSNSGNLTIYGTSAGTPGKVIFGLNNTNTFFKEGNNSTFGSSWQIYTDQPGSTSPNMTLVNDGTGTNPFTLDYYNATVSNMPITRYRRSQGTFASPTAVNNSGENYGALYWDANYNGSTWTTAALIQISADGTPSSTQQPTQFYFNTGVTGSLSTHTVLNLRSSGNVDIPVSGLTLNSPTGGDKGAGTVNAASGVYVNGTPIFSGSGSPEGAKTAPVGALFLRTDGGTSTTLYVKESGSGNTGWIAK